MAPRLRDAHHFGDSTIRICNVAQTKRHGGYLKEVVGEGQALGVRLDEANPPRRISLGSFLNGGQQHFMAEIGADDRRPSTGGFVVGKSQVARSGAQI